MTTSGEHGRTTIGPHEYFPDTEAMGDCAVCGHAASSPMHRATPTQTAESGDLNLDHDEARALHRIVRAMHDGECPKCHSIIPSDRMRKYVSECHPPQPKTGIRCVTHIFFEGTKCPACGFEIDDCEAREVLKIFAPFMERKLAVFEKWRASRNQPEIGGRDA